MTTQTLGTSLSDMRSNTLPVIGVRGGPKALLRLEGAALAAVSIAAYAQLGGGWMMFAALILVPDVSLLGYLAGARVGAFAYNTLHSELGPLALGALGFAGDNRLAVLVAAIWLAHVGIDRFFGYGLKYASAFRDTHLGQAIKFGT